MSRAAAPASSANLGPGFDVLALALDLRAEVEVEPAEAWEIASGGAAVDEAAADLVRSACRAAGSAGPLRIDIESEIPVGCGLGSSAALRAALITAVVGVGDDPGGVFEIAAAEESHPDNAAAACFGGLVAVDASGSVRQLSLHPSLVPVLAVPAEPLSTQEARGVLPETVDRGVAVRTAARIAALVEGLRTGDAVALAAAAGDEIHEAPRNEMTPETGRLIAAARDAGALHAARSGAGPAVIAFVTEDAGDAVREAFEEGLGDVGTVLEPGIARRGVTLESAES